jgi:hypothetical protein
VVVLHPYVFVYGDNGLIKNCVAGNPFDWNGADANETNVASTKIVKGLPVRGGSNAPSGLFWALDSLNSRQSYTPNHRNGRGKLTSNVSTGAMTSFLASLPFFLANASLSMTASTTGLVSTAS